MERAARSRLAAHWRASLSCSPLLAAAEVKLAGLPEHAYHQRTSQRPRRCPWPADRNRLVRGYTCTKSGHECRVLNARQLNTELHCVFCTSVRVAAASQSLSLSLYLSVARLVWARSVKVRGKPLCRSHISSDGSDIEVRIAGLVRDACENAQHTLRRVAEVEVTDRFRHRDRHT